MALCIIYQKIWVGKQPKCSSAEEWINTPELIPTMEYDISIKKMNFWYTQQQWWLSNTFCKVKEARLKGYRPSDSIYVTFWRGGDMSTGIGHFQGRGREKRWPQIGSRRDLGGWIFSDRGGGYDSTCGNSQRMFAKEWTLLCVKPTSVNLIKQETRKEMQHSPLEYCSFHPSDWQN